MSKRCSKCKNLKDESLFSRNPSKKDGLHNHCKSCRSEYQTSEKVKLNKNLNYQKNRPKFIRKQKEYVLRNHEKVKLRYRNAYRKNIHKILFRGARARALRWKLPFNLTPEDIIIPQLCPVLGMPLKVADDFSRDNSPSIDRIVPHKGYTKENIIVVSHRANTIKNNSTPDELRKIADFYDKLK